MALGLLALAAAAYVVAVSRPGRKYTQRAIRKASAPIRKRAAAKGKFYGKPKEVDTVIKATGALIPKGKMIVELWVDGTGGNDIRVKSKVVPKSDVRSTALKWLNPFKGTGAKIVPWKQWDHEGLLRFKAYEVEGPYKYDDIVDAYIMVFKILEA